MLDIKFIRQNQAQVEKAIKDKGIDLDLDKLLQIAEQRSQLLQRIENLRRVQKNKSGQRLTEEEISQLRLSKNDINTVTKELAVVEKEYQDLMLLVPNIPSADTPVGKDESSNKEVVKWGQPKEFKFKPKSHMELAKDLDLIDFEAGVKTAGFRGYYLKNQAVLLHFALLWFTLNKLVKKGFAPMVPPTLLRAFALQGSGHFPFGKQEVYQVANPGKLADGQEILEPVYLAGTSEPSLLAYFQDKTLTEADLPIKACGISQCYRSEVGSYGKDAQGLYRLHEFMKVEQIMLCKNDLAESNQRLEQMRAMAQEILKDLDLPHRVMQICTGDMGAGKYKMYDIETWMPSRGSYGETHSDSNLTDWQARRLNIKYQDKNGKKNFVFALNNTGLASPRILIPILENYQQADGSIKMPKVLHKLLGFKKIKKTG